jgi:hypothetical protein
MDMVYCSIIDTNGNLWFGTDSEKSALVRFDHSIVEKDPDPPVVFIQGLKIQDEPVPWANLLKIQKN